MTNAPFCTRPPDVAIWNEPPRTRGCHLGNVATRTRQRSTTVGLNAGSVQAGESGQDPPPWSSGSTAPAARWSETKFIPELRVACKVRNKQTPPWRIRVRQDDTVKSTDAQLTSDAGGFSSPRFAKRLHHNQPRRLPTPLGSQAADLPQSADAPRSGRTNGRYRQLEHFVEGPSNQLAYRSCVDCWKTPSMPPHNNRCSCTAMRRGKPTCYKAAVRAASNQFSRIRYYSAEQFTNEYIRLASANTT